MVKKTSHCDYYNAPFSFSHQSSLFGNSCLLFKMLLEKCWDVVSFHLNRMRVLEDSTDGFIYHVKYDLFKDMPFLFIWFCHCIIGFSAECSCQIHLFIFVSWLLQYAHRRCVQRWCNEKGDTMCEICHQVIYDLSSHASLYFIFTFPSLNTEFWLLHYVHNILFYVSPIITNLANY